MTKGSAIIGWKLAAQDRASLLDRFPPRYARTIADHVTLAAHVPAATPLPSDTRAEVIGRADDDAGVEALVVAIDGSSDRPDGGTYHITWSLGAGRQARESNEVIARKGFEHVAPSILIALAAARLR